LFDGLTAPGPWRDIGRDLVGSAHTESPAAAMSWAMSDDAVVGFDPRTTAKVPNSHAPATVADHTLTWDARGRLQKVADGSTGADALTIDWTRDNRPALIETAGGTEERFYDASGRLARIKFDSGESIDRIYDGPNLLREVAGCGSRTWLPGPAGQLDTPLDEPLGYDIDWNLDCGDPEPLFEIADDELDASGKASFALVQDMHRDVVAVVDAAGEVAERSFYTPDGERVVLSRGAIDPATGERGPGTLCTDTLGAPCRSRVGNPLGYVAAWRSPVSGLLHLRDREYLPELRIFASPDPAGLTDSTDVWMYVTGDPVNFWDPWGWEGTPTEGDHVAEFWNSFGRNICHSACVVSDSGEQEDRNWPTAVRSESPITSDAEIEDRVNEVLEDREFISDTTESGLVNNQENFFTELFAGIFGMRRGSGSALSEALEEPTGPRGRARTPNEETEAAATARASTVTETEAAGGVGGRFHPDRLVDHFERHGGDFGARTAAEYEQMADRFLTDPRPEGVLERVRPNGDVVRFDPSTDTFGVVSRDGTIRTFYRPDPAVHGRASNLEYFNAQ
jgi:RHS repeat-associated protein